MKPQHAQLFATDLDEATLIRYIDRFLMFYVRTADRLQRTATWLNNLEGGIDYLRERHHRRLARHLRRARGRDGRTSSTPTQCEWKATLEDPEKLRAVPRLREQRRARSEHRLHPPSAPSTARRTWEEKARRAAARDAG